LVDYLVEKMVVVMAVNLVVSKVEKMVAEKAGY
jgi:hypothetical protein